MPITPAPNTDMPRTTDTITLTLNTKGIAHIIATTTAAATRPSFIFLTLKSNFLLSNTFGGIIKVFSCSLFKNFTSFMLGYCLHYNTLTRKKQYYITF